MPILSLLRSLCLACMAMFSLQACSTTPPDCGSLHAVSAQAAHPLRYDESYLRSVKSDSYLLEIFTGVNLFEDLDKQDALEEKQTWSGNHAQFLLQYEKKLYLVGMYRDEDQFSVMEVKRNRPNNALNELADASIALESPELYAQLLAYLKEHPVAAAEPFHKGDLYLVASFKTWRFNHDSRYHFGKLAKNTKIEPSSSSGAWLLMRPDINEWMENLPSELFRYIVESICGNKGKLVFIPGRRDVQREGLIAGYGPADLFLPALFATQDPDMELEPLMSTLQLLYQLHELGYIEVQKVYGEELFCWTDKAYKHQADTLEEKKGLSARSLHDELAQTWGYACCLIDGTPPALLYTSATYHETPSIALNHCRAAEGYVSGTYSPDIILNWSVSRLTQTELWLSYLEVQEEMQPYSPNSLMSPRECQEITIKGWQDALPEQGARSQYHIYSFPKGDIKSYYQSRRKKPILFF